MWVAGWVDVYMAVIKHICLGRREGEYKSVNMRKRANVLPGFWSMLQYFSDEFRPSLIQYRPLLAQ